MRFGQIARFDVAIDVAPASGEPRNYLLVGSDSREGLDPDDPSTPAFFDDEGTFTEGIDVQRTDTIMVLRVDPDAGEAHLLSLPRDLWVPIADTGENNRINAAYSRGREVLVDTIRQNFGIPIHHYVEVDIVGLPGLGRRGRWGAHVLQRSGPRRLLRAAGRHAGLREPRRRTRRCGFARSRFLEIQDPDDRTVAHRPER